nr:heat stress transcription factor A-1B-like [Ipomoea batatas]
MVGVHESTGGKAIENSPPPFLCKTYDMVDDPSTDAVVSWSKSNQSFVVWNVPRLTKDILPKYFKHNNFSSFVRQLNTYGFRKIDTDHWEFANEGFLRGDKHLLKTISRIEEVDALKRDKDFLMQELRESRQHQQATDHMLQSVGQRVHLMEQRRMEMMLCLAKAIQSPFFIAQFVNQQSDNNRCILGVDKKRRLPTQEEENFVCPVKDCQVPASSFYCWSLNGAMLEAQLVKKTSP